MFAIDPGANKFTGLVTFSQGKQDRLVLLSATFKEGMRGGNFEKRLFGESEDLSKKYNGNYRFTLEELWKFVEYQRI